MHVNPQPKGFPHSSVGKESSCNAEDPGLIPGVGRSPGEGNGNPLQYSCLENPRHQFMGLQRVGHKLVTKPPPQPRCNLIVSVLSPLAQDGENSVSVPLEYSLLHLSLSLASKNWELRVQKFQAARIWASSSCVLTGIYWAVLGPAVSQLWGWTGRILSHPCPQGPFRILSSPPPAWHPGLPRPADVRWALWAADTPCSGFLVSKREVDIQLSLVFQGFHICEVICLLKVTGTTKINTCSSFSTICKHLQSGGEKKTNVSHPVCFLPAVVEQGDTLPSCFDSYTVNRCPFCDMFSAIFFLFCIFFSWWFPYLKWLQMWCWKHCFGFISARMLWCDFWRKYVS